MAFGARTIAPLVIFLLAVRPGAAHAELERAAPQPDALLAAAPLRLELWFTEAVAAADGSPVVRLLDAAGRDQEFGQAEVDAEDPRRVTAEMPALGPGTYTVVWSVRSAVDGHTLSGSYAFRLGGGNAPGAATVEGETPRAWAVATRWLTFLGAALVAGGAFLVLLLAPESGASRRTAGLVLAGGVVALFATLAEPLLQTLDPPAGAETPTLREAIRGLPDAWWLRPALLLPAVVAGLAWLALVRRDRPLPGAAVWVILALGLGGILGLSLTSHAAARETWRAVAVASDILHQWSVALWVGGLAHLALVRLSPEAMAPRQNRKTGDPPPVDPGTGGAGPPTDSVRRFSRLALGLVAVGVATGTVNAGFVLPAIHSLWESDYGRVILVKVAVLIPALALATFHRRALRTAARLGATLRPTIRIETVVVVLVALGGSVLSLLAPPVLDAEGPRFADLAAPLDPTLGDAGPILRLRVEPVAPGENALVVFATEPVEAPGQEPPRRPLDPTTEVELTLTPLNHELEPVVTAALPDGAGGFRAGGLDLSLDGWWRIDVRVRPPGELGVRQSFFVLLPDPNVHGADAIDAPGSGDDRDEAAAVYERGLAALTGLHSLTWEERIADGSGHLVVAEYALSDGTSGAPAAFSITGTSAALIRIGSREWVTRGDGAWSERATAATFVPADFRAAYDGATDFRLGRIEEIDGEPCRIVTFFVPEAARRSEAWYTWWVGEETGLLRQETMVARGHYMLHRFGDFDAPVTIVPPVSTATPAATAVAAGHRRGVQRSRPRRYGRGR